MLLIKWELPTEDVKNENIDYLQQQVFKQVFTSKLHLFDLVFFLIGKWRKAEFKKVEG